MIKEISIRNYRIFKGLQKIELSTDKVTPVTIISAANASGKTTLIDAVYWCLYGKSPMKDDTIFNHERQLELKNGELETVEVELLYSEDQNSRRIYRSMTFKKVGNKVTHCPEWDRHSIGDHSLFPAETIAQTVFLSELFHIMHGPRFENEINKVGTTYLRRYLTLGQKKLTALCDVLMSRIALEASSIFKDLYFRGGTYNIVWNGRFSLLRADRNNTLINDLSSPDQLVFNLALAHGIRHVFLKAKMVRQRFLSLLMMFSGVPTSVSFHSIN